MKFIKTQYTVKEEFVQSNKANIKSMMDHLRSLGRHDIKYTVYMLKDQKSFVHLAQYANLEAQEMLLDFHPFKYFIKERDAHLEVTPESLEMSLVGSTFDIFTIREEYIEF